MIQVGQTYTHDFKFTQEEVNRFAEVTGDKNPVHTNAEFAAKTIFKSRLCMVCLERLCLVRYSAYCFRAKEQSI